MTSKRILVVEDERLIAHNLKKILEQTGYEVPASVAYAEEAVELAANGGLDLVLMDVRLKGKMDGIEAAEIIVGRYHIPVVFLTSYTDESNLKRAAATHSYGYLLKPFQAKPLQIAIEMALSKHEMEKQLQEREQWLDATLGSIADGVLATDQEQKVLFVNRAAERLTGWSREEAEGRDLDAVLALTDERRSPRRFFAIEDVMEKGETLVVQEPVYLDTRGGDPLSIHLIVSPLRDRAGEPRGAVVAFQDVSELKALESRLRQTQKAQALSTLASGVAHDFNNLLSAINGYTELAIASAPAEGKFRDHLNQVTTAATRASDLVGQILAFSRQTEQTPVSGPIHPVIREALKLLTASLPATIEIVTDIDEFCGPVLADPTRIHQVLMNLCTNAYHAMRDSGGTLTVQLARHGTQTIRLTVADTGSGMDEETLSRVFDPYFTTKPVGEGTGLGLSVVQGIVTNCGGGIRIESEPGAGTTIRVDFPVDQTSVALTSADTPESVETSRGERILFVDDEALVADAMGQLLEEFGYRVECRTNSVEALREFGEHLEDLDMVITDQTMPGMSGEEFAAALLEIRKDLPVILSTGDGEALGADEARAAGFQDVIRKPLSIKKIRQVIDGVFAARTP